MTLKIIRLSNRATGTNLLVLSHCLALYSDLSLTTFRVGITRSAIFLLPSYVSSAALSGSDEVFPGIASAGIPCIPMFDKSVFDIYRKMSSESSVNELVILTIDFGLSDRNQSRHYDLCSFGRFLNCEIKPKQFPVNNTMKKI